jgi:tryptophan-rich sensory protein
MLSSETNNEPTNSARNREWAVLVVTLAICLGAGAIGAWLTRDAVQTWYPTLRRPPLAPPNSIFGPVWTTLYVMMAVAAWRVWRLRRDADVCPALRLFAAQLALNTIWSGLFFYLRNPATALAEIVVMEATILATTFAFRRVDVKAATLLLPYVAWVAFATYLNAGFWWLNR